MMKMNTVKTLFARLAFILMVIGLSVGGSHAAQQYEGLCSYVKIEILQELALERIGFLATLTVTNNENDASITNFSATLTFEKEGIDGDLVDASDLFFMQPPKFSGVSSIDGAGIISPGQTATVEWFIIPKPSAGGTTPQGLPYEVGALLAGSIYGMEISQDVFNVLPDTITVKPDPELEITYFQPRDVDGDNPFTLDIVESPIPFTLGVLVKNVGYGTARNVTVSSEQPRIVENLQGLLVVPQLIGARVDDAPTDSTTLTVALGDIFPGGCRKGAWDMITTLSGEFTEFRASYTHSPELGGEATSIIRDINAYFIVHEVLNDQPGRDDLLDFLAETQGGEELIPDTLFESDCNTLPVNRLSDVEVLDFSNLKATIRATADFENWVFMRVDDPGQARYEIISVVRSDGKVLDPHNYWTHIRYRESDNAKLTYLNIFDVVSLGEYEYTVTYQAQGEDDTPPVTTMLLSGESFNKNGKDYILPETEIFFITEDDSPTGTYYKLDDEVDFLPAYPFTIQTPGEHLITYYSEDLNGNVEDEKTATVVVSVDDPGIENLSSDTEELFIAGDSISVRPTLLTTGFNGIATADGLSATVEIFKGVFGYPVVSDVPVSPTAGTAASLIIGGENVDFYRYHTGDGNWSDEFPVSVPVVLEGLTGVVTVSISGRSQYGDYHPDDQAVTVSWVVDASAPAIDITGTPATPTRSSQATLSVVGSNYYCYRTQGSYYRPDAGAGTPITLSRLEDGEQLVEVIARIDDTAACPGDVPGTAVKWTVDRLYGLRFPMATRVRFLDLGTIDGDPVEFSWDGRTDSGAVAAPGWYSMKITVQDGLSRTASTVKLVYVGDMIAEGNPLAAAGNAGQRNLHAAGKWVVWEDQRQGNWDIFTRDLSDDAATETAVTTNGYNQEKPNTDGRFVVWQDRQADGSWDIWAKDLDRADPAFAVTTTPDRDEQNPAVDWPWIVFQSKPVDNPNAPWQLMAYHMENDTLQIVDTTSQDQLDPAVQRQRVVWQDFRDVGYGEIYMKHLDSGEITRITDNTAGQYHPVVFDQWIVWADNRDQQLDLYGYNLYRQTEVQLTDTPADEDWPYLNGDWVVYAEDSSGEEIINLRIAYLDNLATVQLTNEASQKERPCMAFGKLLWVDLRSGNRQVMAGPMPDLQPVFNNRNAVAVTAEMAANQQDAYTLLRLWNRQADVQEITRFTSLLPQPVAETVTLAGGSPVGDNFALEDGGFLWVRFGDAHILDLGSNPCSPLNLNAGVNAISYACFPHQYTAYQLIRELGEDNINALRAINSRTGHWRTASVVNDQIVGEDFSIPTVGVLMVDMKSAVSQWQPGEMP